MAKKFVVSLIHNKKNGQINISIPKRKLSKENLLNLNKSKKLKISILGFS